METLTTLKGFPVHVLKKQQRVVSLFTAAFGGKQDVKFIHAAGVSTCLMVDSDSEKLSRMPFPFEKLCADCFVVIDFLIKNGEKFDVVTSDQWTSLDKTIHEDYFEKICAIAPVRVLGISQPYLNSLPKVPAGTYYKRSEFRGGVYWRLV